MAPQPPIEWRLHLGASPETAWRAWATDSGRERFWAERSGSNASGFTLHFINGQSLDVEVVESAPASRFVFRYFGGSTVSVAFAPDGKGGCDVHLLETNPEDFVENHAGWVSVLMAFKAAVDFDVDLRSHDPERTWDQGYADC